MRKSTGGVKLRRVGKIVEFTVPDILPIKHLVGKDFVASYTVIGGREVISFTYMSGISNWPAQMFNPVGPKTKRPRRMKVSLVT